jgi:hypothetical protein
MAHLTRELEVGAPRRMWATRWRNKQRFHEADGGPNDKPHMVRRPRVKP